MLRECLKYNYYCIPWNLWWKFSYLILSNEKYNYLLATHLLMQASGKNLPLNPRQRNRSLSWKFYGFSWGNNFASAHTHDLLVFGDFLPHIAIEAKTTAELASRGREQKNTRHLHNMIKCHQKWYFWCHDANKFHQGLFVKHWNDSHRVGAHCLHLQFSCMWLKSWPSPPSHNKWILQLAALPLHTPTFNLQQQ